MNGGKDCEAEDEHHVAPVQVPIGWQRKAEPSKGVIYISPSGSVLASYDQVKAYLLTDGTCKCGLECPLILHKVFNFDPGAVVKQRTAEDVRSDEDVTKLCIHKRKLLAVATLHRSIETHPALTLTGPGGVTGAPAIVSTHSTTQRAIRTIPHDGLPNLAVPDCKNPFKMMLAAGQQQRLYPPHEVAGAQQGEFYPGYPRQHRLGNPEPGPKSPYRAGYGGMLSPPPSSSKLCGDGLHSPSTDTLGSPDGLPGCHRTNQCGFPGAVSIHGNSRTPLSPSSMLLHGSPVSQPACAMTGRTSTPLSPTATAKSPVMNMARGNVRHGMDIPRVAFHHKPQPALHPGPPLQSIPPACALQKRLMTSSEKDPLGILDPIPSKPICQSSANSPNPSNFQPSLHSQVPMMNVNIPPPAIVPLPSNLPLPTGKSGPVGHLGHVQRSQQAGPTSSMSPSPVTSPVHMSGRMEASPHHSHPSSASLDHGNFAMLSGHQGHPGSMKAPPRSPRSAMGSPHPAMPSSPSSNKADLLHQYKDPQMLSGMGNSVGAQQHNNPMYSPTSSSSSSLSTPSASQKGHPGGLLGMPLNQILNQQNAASFPASSLLSAAAKAQLAYQNKHTAVDNGTAGVAAGAACGGMGNMVPGGGGGVNEVGSRQPGFLSSPRGMEGHSTLNPMLPPNSTMLLNTSEAQSGRAALRDKLMAQQRDPLRKRKQSSGAPAASLDGGNSIVYSMLNKPGLGGPRVPGPSSSADQLRKVARIGGLPPNTSMAQLLQSMSHQGSHNVAGSGQRPGLDAGPGPPGAGQLHCGDGTTMALSRGPPQHLLAQQRLRGPGEPMQHCQNMDVASGGHPGPRPNPQHHPGLEMRTQMHAASMGNCGPMRPECPQEMTQNIIIFWFKLTTHLDSPYPSLPPKGNPSSLSCSMGGMQSLSNSAGAQMYQQQLQHQQQHQHQQQQHQQQFQQGMQQAGPPHPAHHPTNPYQGQQHFPDNPPYPDGTNVSSMPCVYQNYQGMMANHGQYGDGRLAPQQQHRELPSQGEGLPVGTPDGEVFPGGGGGPEAVDAIYRAVVDAASKGVHVTITTTVSGTTQAGPSPALGTMSAFATSVGEPVSLPRTSNASLHCLQEAEAPSRGRQARVSRPQETLDPGKGMPDAGADPGDFFRSPSRGTPRGQWDGESQHGGGFEGQSGSGAAWGGEEFLECSTQVRSSPCIERPAGLTPAPPCPTEASQDHQKGFIDDGGGGYRTFNHVIGRGPAHYKERLEPVVDRCGQLNGTAMGQHFVSRGGYSEVLGPARQELTGDDQSPGSSTSLDGPLATGKDYGHYNGHYNGAAASPSDTKSLSSEEELRQPDSPSSELLHYRSRSFHMGELVWGPLKGFPPWPAKLAGDQPVHGHAAMHLREQAKVEPEKLKTLTHDLEAYDRATKRNRKPGKLNNHLEAAIHEAMSELDKISGTVHQMPSRERQVRPPKPKRRKISR
ncbi:unnamed protein product [Merluccius merluccius]